VTFQFPIIADAANASVDHYDRNLAALVPCVDGLYANAVEAIIDGSADSTPRILIIGAGAGLLAAQIRAALPHASLHLVDVSESLLQVARARFPGDAAISFEIGDIGAYNLAGPWDAVVSSLCVHILPDSEKKALFERIHAALRLGGMFIMIDQVLGPSLIAEARTHRIWQNRARTLGISEADLSAAKNYMKFGRCAPVEAQLRWLDDVGFIEVDCSFKAWRFAVLISRRAFSTDREF
jgi:trans-aconitate methyltransferase